MTHHPKHPLTPSFLPLLAALALPGAACTVPNPMMGEFGGGLASAGSTGAPQDTDGAATEGSESGSGSSAGDTDPGTSGSTGAVGVCGDGELDPGEACDDGNTEDGDGCEADCSLPTTGCGTGQPDPGEFCHALGAPADLGGAATQVVAGDLDGDGRDEIVAAVPAIGRVVRVSHDGAAPLAVDAFFAGLAPTVLDLADIDGDFELDAIAAGEEDVSVYLLPGDGAGGFTTPMELAIPDSSDALIAPVTTLRAAHLDTDGRPDLLLATGSVGVLNLARSHAIMAQPGGSWATPASLSAGAYYVPAALAATDLLNGDGVTEVLTLGADKMRLQIPSAPGEFDSGLYMEWDMPANVTAAEVVDLNADGRDEIVVALGDDSLVRVLSLDDVGNLSPDPVDVAFAGSPLALATPDLDADGRGDLAVALADNSLQLLLQQGDGTFAPLGSVPLGGAAVDMVSTDLNADGEDDLAIAREGFGELLFLISNP